MRELCIFLNVGHVPKIWGVPYPKALATVGLLIFTTVAGNALSGGAGTIVKVFAVIVAVMLAGGLHVFFILMERNDASEKDLPFIKDEQNSQDSSRQTVKLLATAPRNKGKIKK